MKTKLSLVQRENAKGYLFILPLIIGFIFFFAYPFVRNFIWSFGEVSFQGELSFRFNGFPNYVYALRGDPQFYKLLITAVTEMFVNLPLILIFSFLMANLLKAEFPGRNIIRMIIFLPVILSAGIVTSLEDYALAQDLSGAVSITSFQQFLLDMNIPTVLSKYISDAVNGVSDIVNKSGIQILIFLSALQSISPSVYEAASIEGATAWESFWKITFPLVLPQIIVCMMYTVVDCFVNSNSETMKYIYNVSFVDYNFGVASAMSAIYTVVILLIIALFVGTASYAANRYDA